MTRILALTDAYASEACTAARLLTPLSALAAVEDIVWCHQSISPWRVARHMDVVGYDLLWITRPLHVTTLPYIRWARARGIPILIDLDDWLLDVPVTHPEAAFFRQRARQETLRAALFAAHAITVSTPVIAERCAALGLQAILLPNVVDTGRYIRLPRAGGPVTIGFAGSASHRDDVALITPALRHVLMTRCGNVRVITVGCPVPTLMGMDGYTHYDAVSAANYPDLLSDLRLDIGLAPLQDTPFNHAKSDIKYLEYAATGAATLASPVKPFTTTLQAERGVLVRLNTPAVWTAMLDRLVTDTMWRRQLADNAYIWVQRERSIATATPVWSALVRRFAEETHGLPAPAAAAFAPKRYKRVLANIVLHDLERYRRAAVRRVVQTNPYRHRSVS